MNKSNTSLDLEELTSLTPLDGRYRERLKELAPFVSEYALIKVRIEVEIKYLQSLSKVGVVRKLEPSEIKFLTSIYEDISFGDIREVKKIEQVTRHDVKAVERMLRNKLTDTSLSDVIEKIHFGLTSEDINNLSYRLMLFRGTQSVIIPKIKELLRVLTDLADANKSLPMLARTHGQAAVTTTLGKELVIFASRLSKQLDILEKQKLTGKLNGAVGNFNALSLTFPDIDWIFFSEEFVTSLGLIPNLITTQINTYDDVSEYFQIIERINNIIIGFDQDMWRYISDGWFAQVVKKGEVGSSTMPQKVNPIDFENSEGNLGLANSLLEYMARKLAISRLQRDLTDSTTIRNLSTVLSYSLIGYTSVLTGMTRVRPNEAAITDALLKDWTILTEGVQTILRNAGVDDPYSLVSSLSRGQHIGQKEWVTWIETLPIGTSHKKLLASLTPETYIGLAVQLTERAIDEIRK
ncbi:adenylosuccinate lyase [soil metagenome]